LPRRRRAAISTRIPSCGRGPASPPPGRRPCWCRWSTAPIRPCCTAELQSHAGQVAFPGGKIDPHDATPAAAAMREAEEEIGLSHGLIEPIGYLDLYLTFSGFRVLPTVARVAPDYRLIINPSEVADAFEVPLAFLMDAQNHALHSRDWKGMSRRYYAMPFGERYIWGVTAGILRNLYERIYGA
jgi:8-oxo-dGTP pyrophosphatase MutT (NUDIX family)